MCSIMCSIMWHMDWTHRACETRVDAINPAATCVDRDTGNPSFEATTKTQQHARFVRVVSAYAEYAIACIGDSLDQPFDIRVTSNMSTQCIAVWRVVCVSQSMFGWSCDW